MDEATWIRRLEARDEEAWNLLMSEYDQKIARYAMTVWKIARDDAGDVTQEVFRRVFVAANRAGMGTSLGGLIFREARSACIDFLRRTGAGKRLPPSALISTADNRCDDESEGEMDLPSYWAIPDEEAQRTDRKAFVDRALGLLGQSCRELILLRYMRELSQEELVGAVGKPRGSVSSDLTRCKQALGKIMSKLWDDLGGEKKCGFNLR